MKLNFLHLGDIWAEDSYLDVSVGQQQVYYNVSRQDFNIIHSLSDPRQLGCKLFACVEGSGFPDVVQNGFPEILAGEQQLHISNWGQLPCICFSGPAALPQRISGTFIDRAVSMERRLGQAKLFIIHLSQQKAKHHITLTQQSDIYITSRNIWILHRDTKRQLTLNWPVPPSRAE